MSGSGVCDEWLQRNVFGSNRYSNELRRYVFLMFFLKAKLSNPGFKDFRLRYLHRMKSGVKEDEETKNMIKMKGKV